MYSEKLVACIKINGKVIREDGENVYIPFGSDYSIYFKNLHTEKCKISVTIDGENVLNDVSILLGAKESIDLEGFLQNNRVKNKFRFIEKTHQISKHRGDNPEDGLIVITYCFNQPIQSSSGTVWYDSSYQFDFNNQKFNTAANPLLNNINICSTNNHNLGNSSNTYSCNINSCEVKSSYSCDHSLNDKGITVKGKETDQQFRNDNSLYFWGTDKTMIIHLKGDIDQKKINKIVTTHKKIKCEICGIRNKSNSKYCRNCGTFLSMY